MARFRSRRPVVRMFADGRLGSRFVRIREKLSLEEYAKLMFDLQVLAYQSDLTRVTTFMMSRELSGRPYPEIGVPEAHHPISHHQDDPAKIASIAKINAFHTTLFAYYLEKLRSTADGDGSLLDHMMILYGAVMADSNRHSPSNLPILVAGRGAGQLKALLEKLGVPLESLGNSTGKMELDPLSLL